MTCDCNRVYGPLLEVPYNPTPWPTPTDGIGEERKDDSAPLQTPHTPDPRYVYHYCAVLYDIDGNKRKVSGGIVALVEKAGAETWLTDFTEHVRLECGWGSGNIIIESLSFLHMEDV